MQILNNNIRRAPAWRSTNVEISTAGIPIKLSAFLAVERPRNFRLRAGLAASNEADLGSNRERFWFWMRRSPYKHVLTSSHKQAAQVEQMMNIPFQPDWLMEVFGVIPLNGSEFVMQPEPDQTGIVSLVSERTTPAGEPVRRVILVDTCHGHIIAHELYDRRNRLIARAELNDYRLDAGSGASLPHRIHLDWPEARMAITMRIRSIEVNPPAIPLRTWDLPEIPGYPVLDLNQVRMRPAAPGRARVGGGAAPYRRPVQQTGWDGDNAASSNQDRQYDGPQRTASLTDPLPSVPQENAENTPEIPPWDDVPEIWKPPISRKPMPPGGRVGIDESFEEPPWDEEFSSGPVSSSRSHPEKGDVRQTPPRNLPVRQASLPEEPPWDIEANPPLTNPPRTSRPRLNTMLELFTAPFARFRRGE